LFVFLFISVSFGACGTNVVLDLPPEEAAGRLRQGDIDFILTADPRRMGELQRLHPSAPFYAGLLAREREAGAPEDGGLLSAALFEAALESPSRMVRAAAAAELFNVVSEGEDPDLAERLRGGLQKKRASFAENPFLEELYGASLYTLGKFEELAARYRGREPSSPQARALFLLASLGSGENRAGELLDFLLSGSVEGLHRWVFRELGKFPPLFSAAETAAVSGRFSLARLAYDEGLNRFRIPLEGQRDLFFKYPDLLSDLGRAFQYTSAGEEGVKLFEGWDELAAAENGFAGTESGNIRFRLWYYGGRILRQRGQQDEAARFFTRALLFAPDSLQRDACIWYILRIALDQNPAAVIPLLETYVPLWFSPEYFADILDRLSRELLVKRQWNLFLEVFSLIRGKADGAAQAKYAYVIGRAIQEGYIAAKAGGAARDYFHLAWEEKDAPYYYRVLSASALGEKMPPIPEEAPTEPMVPPPASAPGEKEAFFQGFFTCGAGEYAFSYLERVMGESTIAELRRLAEIFAEAGRWGESVRITAHYMGRDDYELTRRDLELAYPRPFSELIEGNAQKEGLSPEILYGLIRTESAFIPGIGSRAGAIGLTQLMPPTARDMADRIRREGGPDYRLQGEIDLTNPEVNVPLGSRYLRYLIDRMGSPMLALLAYNGGMGRLPRWRAGQADLPEDLFPETIELPETRDYGRKVLSAAIIYGYLYYDLTMEAVIADIFKE
jgi:soluble lytic murein transglycosylase